MVDFMLMMLNLAWKILGVVFGFMLFKYIIRNGTGTFREIIETIGIGIRAMCVAGKKKLLHYLRKEAGIEDDQESDNNNRVEATIE